MKELLRDNALSIVGLVVALLAISNDSLLWRLWPTKTFSVVTSAALGGPIPNPLFGRYFGMGGEYLTPLSMVVQVSIRNESDSEQFVAGVAVEVGDQQGKWRPVRCLAQGRMNGVYWATDRTKAVLLNIAPDLLVAKLGLGSIKPGGVVSGWVVMLFPSELTKLNPYKLPLRISLLSGFGDDEVHERPGGPEMPDESCESQMAGIRVESGKVDISSLEIRPLAPRDVPIADN